jgi:hypothetical protein
LHVVRSEHVEVPVLAGRAHALHEDLSHAVAVAGAVLVQHVEALRPEARLPLDPVGRVDNHEVGVLALQAGEHLARVAVDDRRRGRLVQDRHAGTRS